MPISIKFIDSCYILGYAEKEYNIEKFTTLTYSKNNFSFNTFTLGNAIYAFVMWNQKKIKNQWTHTYMKSKITLLKNYNVGLILKFWVIFETEIKFIFKFVKLLRTKLPK